MSGAPRDDAISRPATLPFALAAVAGLASIALPGPSMDDTLVAVACGITAVVLLLGVLLVLRRRERWLVPLLALGYLVVVALLRHASEGGNSGFVPLLFLPIVWLAVFGTRRELIVGLVATAGAVLLPFVVYGDPQYPESALRSGLLLLMVGSLTGLTIQWLLAQARAARDLVSGILTTATETAIVAMDRDGTITLFNTGAERMLGYRAAEVVGSETLALILDADELTARACELGVEEGLEACFAVPRRDGAERRAWTCVRKDGARLQVSLTITVERDAHGDVSRFTAVGGDITERLRAEAALKTERDLTSTAIDTAATLIFVLDGEGRVIRFNQACERLTGMAAADVLGRAAWGVLVPPDDAERVRAQLSGVRPGGLPAAGREHVADRRRRPPPDRVVALVRPRRRWGDRHDREHRHRRHRSASLRGAAARLDRSPAGDPRVHAGGDLRQGSGGPLPRRQPGLAADRRCRGPDRARRCGAVPARRGAGAHARRRGGAADRAGGRARARVGRHDVPRRRLPAARRRRRHLRDRVGRDGHLGAPARAREAVAAVAREVASSWPT